MVGSTARKHYFAGASRVASKVADKPADPGEIFDNNEHIQYFYHPDHLGSSSYVTDIDGLVFQHVEYFPFGETWVEEHSNRQRTPYLFTGKELDEDTQLYYFGARYYDPRTSVWQSPDPILGSYLRGIGSEGGVFNPSNLNLFGYVQQRPLIATDPNGEETTFAEIWAYVRNPVINNSMRHDTEPFTRQDGTQGLRTVGNGYGSIAARWSFGHDRETGGRAIFSPEFGDKTTTEGRYTAGSQNAVRHITLSALSHNAYGPKHASEVNSILDAHEVEDGFVDTDLSERFFSTGIEADSVADRLNNAIGQEVAGTGGRSHDEVMKGIADYGLENGFWQVRTNDDGRKEVYQSRLTQSQYDRFLSAIEAKDSNGVWLTNE